jgi:hypothetical protein
MIYTTQIWQQMMTSKTVKILSERFEFLQAGAGYELVEGLESKYFAASGEEESLHVFAAHAEPASGDACYDFKFRGA